MKSFAALCVLCLLAGSAAFSTVRVTGKALASPLRSRAPAVSARKSAAAEEEELYWQGDWVCKDCGYVYDRSECGGLYFEEQPRGFRCPQCRGPRRRYAKMVGDRVGLTLDGGDAPILLFSFGGLAITVLFGVWAINDFPGL